ncbi:MAG: hypothetical protein K6U04_15730 [Armatimonadetes bacterium]|nr:hypothetical protein [Armatimonadota bacterium]
MVRSLAEIYSVVHPLDPDAPRYGCRIWEGEYLRPYEGNLTSIYGHFPDRELTEKALEIVAFSFLSFKITPRHGLKILVFDTPFDEDTRGAYYDDEKIIAIYATSTAWYLELLINVLVHEIGHYLFTTMGIEDDEELCERLERAFPDDESFMESLAEKWRAARRMIF